MDLRGKKQSTTTTLQDQYNPYDSLNLILTPTDGCLPPLVNKASLSRKRRHCRTSRDHAYLNCVSPGRKVCITQVLTRHHNDANPSEWILRKHIVIWRNTPGCESAPQHARKHKRNGKSKFELKKILDSISFIAHKTENLFLWINFTSIKQPQENGLLCLSNTIASKSG